MTEDTTELLIALVRSRPVLWDKSSDKYRHVVHTKAAWVEVSRKLNEDYDSMTHSEQDAFNKDVIKKWTNLRDAMVKSLRKNRRYVYGDQLQFLTRLYESDPLEDGEQEAEDESKNSLPVEVSPEQLIASVEKWPCLWDKSLATYKERFHMKSAWLAVVQELNPDFDQLEAGDQEHYRKEIVKKWNNVRDNFAKSLKRTAGGGPFKGKKYVYADQMQFLMRFYAAYDDPDPGDEDWRGRALNEEMGVPDPPDVVLQEHVEETVSLPAWDLQAFNVAPAPIQEKPAAQRGHPTQEPKCFTNPKKRKRQERKQHHDHDHDQHQPQQQQQLEQDDIDQRILSVLDRLEPDNRHMSFFKGILPSLENFDEDEVLQFQMQVLQIIRNMRKKRLENLTVRHSRSRRNPTTHQALVKSEVILSESADLSDQTSNSSE